ncbi:MAG: alpha/beta hydrolase [Actinomycetota bacterium]
MASPEFHALQERLAAAPAPPAGETLDEQRARIDANLAQLPVAEGVEVVEHDAGGVGIVECRPEAPTDTAILYAHGGGFRLVSAAGYRSFGSFLARATGCAVVLVDYRLAPEHPHPAALDDMLTADSWLRDRADAPAHVVVAGDSAGANLAPALVLARLAADGPVPDGVVCCSPWADLTNSGSSYAANADSDRMFSFAQATEAAEMYLGSNGDPRDPLVSPVFGDFTGAPPMLIHASRAEVLLDDATRLADVAAAAGVDVDLRLYDEMPHVWPISYPAFPEAVQAVDEITAFVKRVTAA